MATDDIEESVGLARDHAKIARDLALGPMPPRDKGIINGILSITFMASAIYESILAAEQRQRIATLRLTRRLEALEAGAGIRERYPDPFAAVEDEDDPDELEDADDFDAGGV